MSLVLRYACLLGLGLASLFAVVNAGSITGQMVIAGGDASPMHAREISIWVLGGLAALGLLSVIRFMFARIPFILRDWYRDHKNKLATWMMAGFVCVVFVVF